MPQLWEKGHVKKICKSKKKERSGRQVTRNTKKRNTDKVSHVDGKSSKSDSSDSESNLHHLPSPSVSSTPPIMVDMSIDGCSVRMEVDTGAAYTLISESLFQRLWPGRSLLPSSIRLTAYTKQPIIVLGCCNVNLHYEGQTGQLPLLVVKGGGPPLLGRNWFSQIRLNWREIHQVQPASVGSLLARYSSVFKKGLGTLQGYKAKIFVDPDATPRFHRARSVPFALREKVEQELQRLQDEGTLEPVDIADWAAPIVAVLKRDGNSVRICGDFSVTINPVSKLDRYPIPRVDELFSRLSNGKLFSKLDLSQAYQQIPLEETSKKYTVINTHRGLFKYTRLPFGIASAPGIFQRVIESLLQGIDGVIVYLDDILITGKTQEDHMKSLDALVLLDCG